MGHIISDTLRNPFGRIVQSINQLGTLVFDGREATPEENASVRKVALPFDIALKALLPEESAAAGGIASLIEQGETAAKGELPSRDEISEYVTSQNVPRHMLSAAAPRTLAPSRTSPTSAKNLTSGTASAASSRAKEGFKPPTRLEDGRVGYLLSPTRAPQLPKASVTSESVTSEAAGLSRHSERADAAGRPRPAGHTYGLADVPLNVPLRTVRNPVTDRIKFKEVSATHHYHNVAAPGEEPRFKLVIDVDGYASNYRGKGLEAVVMHSSPGHGEPRLAYSRGTEVLLHEGRHSTQVQGFDLEREVTSQQLVQHYRQDHQIDLVSPARGGTGSARPLYLLACNACQGGRESTAQQLADATGREVRAHSRYIAGVVNPSFLDDPITFVKASPSNPYLPLIKLRNRFRTNARSPDQLVHKKFHPDMQAAARAQALRESAAAHRLSFHDFPLPSVSSFTPTQPSSATSPMPAFTHSQSAASHSVPAASHASVSSPSPSPLPTAAGSLQSGFFDHVPPPEPPTFPVIVQSLATPQHATLFQAPSSDALGAGGSSGGALSDFYGAAMTAPQHPLSIHPAPLPHHAAILGPAGPLVASPGPGAAGRITPEEPPETWV